MSGWEGGLCAAGGYLAAVAAGKINKLAGAFLIFFKSLCFFVVFNLLSLGPTLHFDGAMQLCWPMS